MSSALVIGYGSIGARHARILGELGCQTAVLSQRDVPFPLVFKNIQQALDQHVPGYVVIANATDQHYRSLETIAGLGYRGKVLVEKPIFESLQPVPAHSFSHAGVAYNLRLHPIIQKLKSLLKDEKVISVQAYVGQYLPDWRPGTDYRSSYSADSARGGGVLRDLSHELDYLGWLFGPCLRVAALGGHMSSLEINSDDTFSMLLSTTRCPIVSVQLNYLDRNARRVIVVNTNNHTFEADLIRGTFTLDREITTVAIDRDGTYRTMHDAMLRGAAEDVCSLDEGLATLQLINAATLADRQLEWINL
jgi:predicted dehydrogenase